MIFWLIITVLIIVALTIALIPYWRKTEGISPDNSDLNVRLYKHRLMELEADLNNDVLDKDLYDQAVNELKFQLLSDVPENEETRKNMPRRSKPTIIAMVLLVPALSISLYALLGNMDIATGNVDTTTSLDAPEIQDMISALAQRLESEPGDVRGWVMLGRSYSVTDQMDKAIYAYGRAYSLTPKDPEVLTGLAEVLALSNNKPLQERALELLQEALEADPNDRQALWLAGYVEVQFGNNDQAIRYWQTLLSLLPPNDEGVTMVRQHLAQIAGPNDIQDPDPSATN